VNVSNCEDGDCFAADLRSTSRNDEQISAARSLRHCEARERQNNPHLKQTIPGSNGIEWIALLRI
jgi:hypothetical protein